MSQRKYLSTKSLLWRVLWTIKRRRDRDEPVSLEENNRRNEDEPIEVEE